MANQAFQLPTTNIWNAGIIQELDLSSAQFREFLVDLYEDGSDISQQVNFRDVGYYDTREFLNGQMFFPNPLLSSQTPTTPSYRAVARKVINFGALPNAGTKTVAHGIVCTANTSFTRIYATATDPVAFSYLPIPYVSLTLINGIELSVDGTNVSITTGIDRTSYTVVYVILEFLQT